MIFYRIMDNKLYNVHETNTIGFNSNDASFIPDEYLEQQSFVIMRTAHGIGDWGILSALPRLLKQKYPNCEVLIPSEEMLGAIFGKSHKNAYNIFANNPYVDGWINESKGDVFHDQYRIYDTTALNTPLAEQMLKFWQFTDDEFSDSQPELYWTDDEVSLGDSIIQSHTKGDFGCLLVSDRFGTQRGEYDAESYNRDASNMTSILEQNSLPYFYWSYIPLTKTPFNFIDKALDLRHIDLRIQLYIKSKAKVNISNQCGTNHLVVRYSNVYESQRQFPLKHNFVKGIEYIADSEPINLQYFLNMEIQLGGGGKEICHQDGKLTTVRDVVEYWKVPGHIEAIQPSLTPSNWQYFNSMMAGFKQGVEDHHDIGWDKLSASYYEALPSMTDNELTTFLKDNPVDFDNGFIKHGSHRAYAMMGRLIQGKPYIPFYMNREKIYNLPRVKDGKHRVMPLTNKVFGIQEVLDLGIPASEFTITQSGILALMGIRQNDDIDIIISSKIRNELFNGNESFMRLGNGVEIFEKGKSKFMHFGASSEEELIKDYSVNIGGINFLEPRFYLRKKRKDRDKDKKDWEGIHNFFNIGNHKGYPWNKLSSELWGTQ